MKASAKIGYTRERMRLTSEHAKRAIGMVASGKVPGRGLELADEKCQGLVLRVTPRAASYFLRMRTATFKLGDARTLSVEQARDAADTARLNSKHGGSSIRGSLSIFESMIAQGGVDEDVAWEVALNAPTEPEALPEDHRLQFGPWLWRDLVKRFLEHKAKKLRAGYLPQYAAYLRNPAFKAIEDTPVASLRLGDLESVRNAIQLANGPSAVRRGVQQAKEALTWAWRNHAGVTGMVDTPEWWQRLNFDYTPGRRKHRPTIQELARTLVVAERYRSLGDTEHATAPGTLAALWLAMLTGQRTGQLVALPRSALSSDPERPGWQVAIWNGNLMKGGKSGGREHALALPPQVVEILHAWWKEADGDGTASQHCFPSIRGDGHVDNGALNRLLYRLAGVKHGSGLTGC